MYDILSLQTGISALGEKKNAEPHNDTFVQQHS